jgi:hypothetical protein
MSDQELLEIEIILSLDRKSIKLNAMLWRTKPNRSMASESSNGSEMNFLNHECTTE